MLVGEKSVLGQFQIPVGIQKLKLSSPAVTDIFFLSISSFVFSSSVEV